MNWRFIDWIWHIRGTLPLTPEQSSEEVFLRLDPLFRQTGTTHERVDNTLIFTKKHQAAQDKMSTFDNGVLQIENGAVGSVLHYHLISRALLFCFLAPLLFLAFAQLTTVFAMLEKSSIEADKKAGKHSDQSKKAEKKKTILPQNPIDKALGAPAPEKAKKEGTDKSDKEDEKHSPTPAYVFAGLFAALYVVGRVLEDRLVKALFKKNILGS